MDNKQIINNNDNKQIINNNDIKQEETSGINIIYIVIGIVVITVLFIYIKK